MDELIVAIISFTSPGGKAEGRGFTTLGWGGHFCEEDEAEEEPH